MPMNRVKILMGTKYLASNTFLVVIKLKYGQAFVKRWCSVGLNYS